MSEQLNDQTLAERGMPSPVRRSPWKLYLLILICIAPVVASYLAYYVFPPAERTNYGTLVEPQRPVPAMPATLVHGPRDAAAAQPGPAAEASGRAGSHALQTEGLAALKGKWILLAVDRGDCELACAEKLFFMRQTHVSLGKERGRLDRVLLITEGSSLPAAVLAAHPDLVVLRVAPEDVEELLPVAAGNALADHIYVIDPLHNLMMRFPEKPDPTRTRNDLRKLLKASRIG